MCVVIGRNCFEETDASSDDDGMAYGRLEGQSMLVLVPGGGLCGEVLSPLGLLVSASRCISQQKNLLSPVFIFPPLVANQDLILMTSFYSLCFLSLCPTHAFFIFFYAFLFGRSWNARSVWTKMKIAEELVGQCSALFWVQGEKRGSEGGRDVISQMGTLPKMFLLQKAASNFWGYTRFNPLVTCFCHPGKQDQNWDGVVLCGPGDVNGLKPKSAVVTKCRLTVWGACCPAGNPNEWMSSLHLFMSEGPTLVQLLLEKQDQHIPCRG